jgi:helix-turn-helix protein
LQTFVPRHLRPRREKIFGPAPSHRLDGNAKARVWAAATAYNMANRQPRQHQGPLTWATLRVLRALLWRFHGADGGGRCFPSYERIAAAAKCHRDSVCVAIAALEAAGLLTWVHRLTKVRHRERDLFGHWGSEWRVNRTSNGYTFVDPLEREPGRKTYKSENPARPTEPSLKKEGAPLVAAPVMQEETSQAPPEHTERPEIALQREHIPIAGALVSTTERAALVIRLDQKPTRADWAAYGAQLDAMLRSSW